MRYVPGADGIIASMAGKPWIPEVGDLVLAKYKEKDAAGRETPKESPGAISQLISDVEVRVKLAPNIYVKVDVHSLKKLNPR